MLILFTGYFTKKGHYCKRSILEMIKNRVIIPCIMRKKDLLIIAVGSILFAFFLNNISANNLSQTIISPLAESFEIAGSLFSIRESPQIKSIVDSSLDSSNGTYGIVIKNLTTGEFFDTNENRAFESASLYKLWVMATAFKLISEGKLSENKVMTREIQELNRIFDIDQKDAEATKGAITRNVNEAIEQMITISHNYSALLLSAEIGSASTESYMLELELLNSKLGRPPITTAQDIALFYEKLYRGEVINKEYSDRMIEILAKQQLNDRIPKYLPQKILVAHKTGELGALKHDAGIIFGKDSIILVVLSETDSQITAAERIAQLSKSVFEYFEKK